MADKLTKEARLARDARAWSLRCQCWTQQRIAIDLGVDQGTVSRLLARLEARALKALTRKVERVKARQSEQLEYVLAEAMAEWERSKLDIERSTTTERVSAGKGDDSKKTASRTKVTIAERGSGNAALLEQARGALADLRKLWGLDAPQKIAAEIGPAIKLYDVANSPEDL